MIIRLLAAGALAAGVLLTAPTASASPDEDLLDALSAQGIDLPSPEMAIEAANFACNPLVGSLAQGLIAQQVSEKTGLDAGQASELVETAASVYCP
jgi:hypothetical protein